MSSNVVVANKRLSNASTPIHREFPMNIWLRISIVAILLVTIFVQSNDLVAQTQTRKPNLPDPIARLKQFGRRVQHRITQQRQQPVDRAYQLSDRSLARSSFDEYQMATASRIGVNPNYSMNSRAGFVQENVNGEGHQWQETPNVDPGFSVRPEAGTGLPFENRPRNHATQPPGVQGSGSRIPPQNYSPQTQYNSVPNIVTQQNPYYGQSVGQFEDPGLLRSGSDQARFRHFNSRIPASQRAVMLEDELKKVEKELNATKVENEILQNKLDQNEQLLVEIQASIDEAIGQLSSAADANQKLRERIVQLETEKQQQKETADKLLDEVRGQLNELLKSELTGDP